MGYAFLYKVFGLLSELEYRLLNGQGMLAGVNWRLEVSPMTLRYMPGFGNDFETEALPGALPQGQNSPQRCPYGLYAEQLSGTAFTAPHGANARSWLYRMRPSVKHVSRFARIDVPFWKTAPHIVKHGLPLGQLRWDPVPIPDEPLTFVTGMRTMTAAGDVSPTPAWRRMSSL